MQYQIYNNVDLQGKATQVILHIGVTPKKDSSILEQSYVGGRGIMPGLPQFLTWL